MRRNELMSKRKRYHIKVPKADDSTALFRRASHELRNLPCLSRAVTQVGIIRLTLIGCVEMGAEYLYDIPPSPGSELNGRARNAFAHKPVAPEESGGPSVEGVADHV